MMLAVCRVFLQQQFADEQPRACAKAAAAEAPQAPVCPPAQLYILQTYLKLEEGHWRLQHSAHTCSLQQLTLQVCPAQARKKLC